MLTWLAITLVPLVGIAAALAFTPLGPAALALLVNSRLARGSAIALAITWGLLVGAARIRRAGRDEALAEVGQANAAARADRERIEADARRLPDDAVTKELSRWAR